MKRDIIRRCRFQPYRKGHGPIFSLTMWDVGHTDGLGKSILGYELKMDKSVLFEGEDFACPTHRAIDSDDCVRSLMTFLTLRPGDTDAEYFDAYTDEQMEYCQSHAKALALECMNRFGEG